jgi:Flp pilus assembly protein TadB
MTSLDTMLISAIGALAAVIAFLYLDKRRDAKDSAKAISDQNAKLEKAMSERDEKFTKAMADATEKQTRVATDAAEKFVGLIDRITKSHQQQEDEIHDRHDRGMEELVRDHKRELSGMVDRVLEASKNDKDHDREERARILALAEALERRAHSGRGGR